MPPEPVAVLEVDHGAPRLQLFAEVRLDQGLEGIDAQGVHQVLHARVGPDLAVAVVPLGRQNALAQLHHVVLLGGEDKKEKRGGILQGVRRIFFDTRTALGQIQQVKWVQPGSKKAQVSRPQFGDALFSTHHPYQYLVHEAQMVSGAGESVFLVVRPAHATAHHHVETQKL